MMNLVSITRRQVLPVFVSAVILCAIVLSDLNVPTASAASEPQILITLSSADLSVGRTFTMTANLTDFPNLYLYQVVFKYNGTVLNLTNLWFPDDYIFSGQNAVSVWSNETETGDTVDFLNYTVAGATLLGTGNVSVSNGVLCELNFTVVGVGQTAVEIATKSSPAHSGPNTWYTYCEDENGTEYNDFNTGTSNGTEPSNGTGPAPPADLTGLMIAIVVVVVAVIVGVGLVVWRHRRGQSPVGRTDKTSDTTSTAPA